MAILSCTISHLIPTGQNSLKRLWVPNLLTKKSRDVDADGIGINKLQCCGCALCADGCPELYTDGSTIIMNNLPQVLG